MPQLSTRNKRISKMKKTIGLSLLALSFATYGDIMIKNKEKIAFLGDSITQQGHTFDGGYVNLVMDGLSLSGVKAVMIPAGRGGAKSDYMLKNLEDKVLKHKPDWMTLSCGVNDVGHGERGIGLEQYKKNITEILDRCRKAGVKVIVLTPTLCTDSKGWEKHPNNLKLDGYCDFLRKTAAERKLPLVDLNKIHKEKRAAADRPEEGLTSDALHMNGFGNQMMAIAILETMGLSGKQIEKCKLSWKRGKRGFSATGNNTGMVTLDAWEEIKHRAKMQNKSPRQYVQDKIESRVPDINWRRKTYETQELRLSGKAASFDGCVSPLVRITPENAMGDASAKTIKLSSWKNERANAQFVVWTKDAVNQVRVKASCLKGASGTIGADAVDTRFVRYTTASSIRPYGENPITSYVGDILDDAKTLDMNANTFRPVWVTVKVPENAASGEYKGSIDVIGAGGKKVSFNIELEVADRTLPKPADWKFFLDLWQHPWAVARYHSVEPFSKQHYDLMKPLW
jgi:lysophospholipase L1-like esterase